VIFNGDRLWHAVTPLHAGEERIVLSMEYVTNPAMSPVKRFISTMKDAIAYFGLSTALQGSRERGSRWWNPPEVTARQPQLGRPPGS
jgi:hypothetical protein